MINEKRSISTIFAAIFLVIALIIASVGGIETIRLSSSTTNRNTKLVSSTYSNTSILSKISSSSTSKESSSSDSVTSIQSTSSCDDQLGDISPAGSIATNDTGGFNVTSSGFIVIESYNAQNGVEIVYVNNSIITNTWVGNLTLTFPNGTTISTTNGSQPYNPNVGASEDGHIFGGLELAIPVGADYVPYTPFFTSGIYYMSAMLQDTANSSEKFSVNGDFTVSCTPSSTTTFLQGG
jgi:hypothetical protein